MAGAWGRGRFGDRAKSGVLTVLRDLRKLRENRTALCDVCLHVSTAIRTSELAGAEPREARPADLIRL
jgi:hypothetical protein